ncbi:MAG: hypothetical protein IKU86_07650 [Thermoguttaceae bacterium]|nr:hypothetical protein [Thermoguttaceae bacterium]
MRKYYYVCPRCGRCYKRYIPRRKAKCAFCSTVWKTRKAKGTRSAFSWGATLTTILVVAALCFFIGRELGKFGSNDGPVFDSNVSTTAEVSETAEEIESSENVENTETLETTREIDDGADFETTEDGENASAE